jgi:hypothetical protein
MKNKPSSNATAMQLDQARALMHRGHSREALILAMNALLQALNNLRGSLLSLQSGLSEVHDLLPLAPARVKVAAVPRLELVKKPRVLH